MSICGAHPDWQLQGSLIFSKGGGTGIHDAADPGHSGNMGLVGQPVTLGPNSGHINDLGRRGIEGDSPTGFYGII